MMPLVVPAAASLSAPLFGPPTDQTVSVLLGRGDGTFAPRTDYPVEGDAVDLVIGDVTGDGRPDVVTADFNSQQISVLPSQGPAVDVVGPEAAGPRLRVYPNPGSGRVTLGFTLDRAAATSLRIYDLQGRLVDEVVDGWLAAGPHTCTWRPSSAERRPAGLYLARLWSAGREWSARLAVVE
jgi:hypothetical protein